MAHPDDLWLDAEPFEWPDDPENDWPDGWDEETCADCGRPASYMECDVCGLPLCGMCAELGLNVCRDCMERGGDDEKT